MARGNALIIASNQLFCEGLRQLLQKGGRFVVVGEGRDLAEAIDEADRRNPAIDKVGPGKPIDVVILTLEGGSSLESCIAQIGCIRRELPSAKLVALTVLLSMMEFRSAMRAGLDAILTNDISSSVLQTSLELVMRSQQMFLAPKSHLLADSEPLPQLAPPAEVAREEEGQEEASELVPLTLIRPPATAVAVPLGGGRVAPSPRTETLALSEREGQILNCLVKGFSNKVIARELNIAETTVKVHVKGLMRKVRAANRTQAAIWAMSHYFTGSEAADQSVSA